MTTPTTCPGCGWDGYPHRHDDAEDGPRAACCDHTCERALDCGCAETLDHAAGCDRNHYPHDACGTIR